MKVMFDTEDDNDLIINMLKIKDNIVKKPLGIKAYKVFSNRVKAQIFFEKIETKADKITPDEIKNKLEQYINHFTVEGIEEEINRLQNIELELVKSKERSINNKWHTKI